MKIKNKKKFLNVEDYIITLHVSTEKNNQINIKRFKKMY